MFRSLDFKTGGLKSTLFFSNMERNKIASYHDIFGAGKSKVVRPFFSIGEKKKKKYKKNLHQLILKKWKYEQKRKHS